MAEILLMDAERQVHLIPNRWVDTSSTTRDYMGKVIINRATVNEEVVLSILTEKYTVECDKYSQDIWQAILNLQNKVLFVSNLKWRAEEPQKVQIGLGTQLSRQHFKHDEGRRLYEKVVDVSYLRNIQEMFEKKSMRLEDEEEKKMLSEQRYLLRAMVQDVSDKKDDNLYKSCDQENCPNRKVRFSHWEFRCSCGNRSDDYKWTLRLKLTLCDPEDTRCRVEASIFHDKAEKLLGHSTEEMEDMTDRGHRQACDAVIDNLVTVRLKAKVFPPRGSQRLLFDVDAVF